MTDKELDRLVAENVFGMNLKPSRDLALARVGALRVSITGEPFKLDDGRTVSMRGDAIVPNCTMLKKPDDSDDWNDRYYRRVGEFLGAAVAAEVDAYRLPAKPYSTQIRWAFDVVEAIRAKGFLVKIEDDATTPGDESPSAWWCVRLFRPDPKDGHGVGAEGVHSSLPRAICIASLIALGVEVSA